MLQFFRRIRQGLLNENRIRKYLMYAVGEIVLVVIGIWIALQINSYQDYKNDRVKECEYLESLLSDLQIERDFLHSYAEFDKEVISKAEDLIQSFYDRHSFKIDTSFSKNLSILNNRSTFRKHDATYRELLATGGLNLLMDQELKQAIMLHFQTVDQYEVIIRQNNEYVDNHFAPLALQAGTHYVPNHQLKWSKNIMDKGYIKAKFNRPTEFESIYFETISERFNKPLNALALLNQIQYRYRISVVHLSLGDELIDMNGKLLKRVKKGIASCSGG